MTQRIYLQKMTSMRHIFISPVKSFLSMGSAVALFLVLVFLCVAPMAIGATRYTVYFYNPESNVDNFASLKTRLDVYLKNTGPYQFQPFCDWENHMQATPIVALSAHAFKEDTQRSLEASSKNNNRSDIAPV